MHKIVLFGGTTEGRLLTEFLSQNKVPAIVCVATEYGEKVLEYEPPVIVQPKRLKPGPMRKLFEEEQTEFTVTLESFDAAKKIPVIKAVREITGLGLGEAKALVEGAPKTLKEGVNKTEADDMIKKIEEAGGKASKK